MPDAKRPVLMVIDGHSLVYRAYYALAPRTPLNLRSTGEPVGAVFGFANMFLKAWQDVQPSYWAVAFDKATPTFRDKMYEDYKAGRLATPDELTAQFTRIRDLLAAFGIPILEVDGFEADDVVGTLSKRATAKNIETVILTGDTDELQLVDSHTRVRLITGQADTRIYDEAKVRERYGLSPLQLIDFKALKGDTSDNIVGVPGVGEKTAATLIQKYESIDGIYQHLTEVTVPRQPNIQALLKEHEERVQKNKTLVTIVTEVPVPFDFEAAATANYSRQRVADYFQTMEFQSLLARLPGGSNGAAAEATPKAAQASLMSTASGPHLTPTRGSSGTPAYTLVTDEASLRTLASQLRKADLFALDTIATSELSMQAEVVGFAFATAPGAASYVPLGHTLGTQVPLAKVLEVLRPVLEDESIKKIVHNGKFDMTVLANLGVALRGVETDITIAAYLLNAKALSIKGQAFEKLGVEIPAQTDLTGTGAKAISMKQTLPEQVLPYAGARAEATYRLWPLLEADLEKQLLMPLFVDVEMALVPVLERMERWGIAIDSNLLHEMSREMAATLDKTEKAAYESVGHMFKINSPKELSSLLFEELNLAKGKKTKTGYSTDAQILETLREAHPVVGHILNYRQTSKLKATYVDSLPEMVNPRTHRVHTTYSQTGAATGRLSSSDPNLQNIPVRTEQGMRVRKAFIAQDAPAWTLLSADYSQIELRILAHITKDPALVEAFRRDEDIHASTAARVFNVPLAEVTGDQRRFAKVVNFGLLYGMGEFGLATRAEMSREEAAPIIEEYFKKYPGIQAYLEETKALVKKQGYVQTLLGRRRYIPEIHAANAAVRSAGERMAINMPIQGTAADAMKVGMIGVAREMAKAKMRSRMLLQVHDELIFEAPVEELEALKALARRVMPAAMSLEVPLKVDLKSGRNWGEME
ncbi:MAG: DNA polymerase I [Chloroflexi bacterium]|nr:DNA polymerase I [Chloroflexota bacterium]